MTAVPSTHWVWDPRFDDRQRQREGKKFGVWQRRRRRDIGIPAFYSLHRFSVYRQPYFPDSVNNFLLQRRGWETRLGPDCCFVSNSCCQDSDFSVFVNSTFLILLHTVFLLFCKKKSVSYEGGTGGGSCLHLWDAVVASLRYPAIHQTASRHEVLPCKKRRRARLIRCYNVTSQPRRKNGR